MFVFHRVFLKTYAKKYGEMIPRRISFEEKFTIINIPSGVVFKKC